MASAGASMNYDFPQKRHWRRWIWNRLIEALSRVGVSVDEALVLYLPGATNEDEEIALGKGFSKRNLIGIERNKPSLHYLRRHGALVIDGEFLGAVKAVASSRRVDVVFGDFTCGLSPGFLASMFWLLWHKHMARSVLAFNWMRGRDQGANGLRGVVADHFRACSWFNEKHRGMIACSWWMHALAQKTAEGLSGLSQIEASAEWQKISAIGDAHHPLWDLYLRTSQHIANRWSPHFGSYRSVSRQTFDSCVVVNPLCFLPWKCGPDEALSELTDVMAPALITKEAGSARAVMAHRTMRMN